VQCGSQACVNAAQCQQYSSVTSSASVPLVCYTSTDINACGNPNGAGVTCDEFVTGWSGAACMQYTVANNGVSCVMCVVCVCECDCVRARCRSLQLDWHMHQHVRASALTGC
jgi:hypothetical protein